MKRDEILQIAKPILFNTDMVRAILDGRKTVTRRVIKPQPKFSLCYTFAGCDNGTWKYPSDSAYVYWGEEYRLPDFITEDDKKMAWKPPYHTDDILYVRETWVQAAAHTLFYRADNSIQNILWRPSIHMPKEAARIFLRVTNVRVERLQDITADGIRNEGLSSMCVHSGDMEIAQKEFAILWDATIKKSDLDRYGWDANPWVWVIEFERIEVE